MGEGRRIINHHGNNTLLSPWQEQLWQQYPVVPMATTPRCSYGNNTQLSLWQQYPVVPMATTPSYPYGNNTQLSYGNYTQFPYGNNTQQSSYDNNKLSLWQQHPPVLVACVYKVKLTQCLNGSINQSCILCLFIILNLEAVKPKLLLFKIKDIQY